MKLSVDCMIRHFISGRLDIFTSFRFVCRKNTWSRTKCLNGYGNGLCVCCTHGFEFRHSFFCLTALLGAYKQRRFLVVEKQSKACRIKFTVKYSLSNSLLETASTTKAEVGLESTLSTRLGVSLQLLYRLGHTSSEAELLITEPAELTFNGLSPFFFHFPLPLTFFILSLASPVPQDIGFLQ